MKYACALLLALSTAFASEVIEIKKISEMTEDDTVSIGYEYKACFAVDDRDDMRIRVNRRSSGWYADFIFKDRITGEPASVSLRLNNRQIAALDEAIAPKIYGKDDIQLSGEHMVELHWSTGEVQRLSKTGDDDRFSTLVWTFVTRPIK